MIFVLPTLALGYKALKSGEADFTQEIFLLTNPPSDGNY
jgi:hypothetical protein